MALDLKELIRKIDPEVPERHWIVRIRDERYFRGSTMVYSRTMRTIKRLSQWGYVTDLNEMDQDIVNFHDVEPGVYEVVTCNHSYDWETGILDDWMYKLVPYVEKDLQS